MLKRILNKIREAIGSSETELPPSSKLPAYQRPKREHPTKFQAVWDVIRQHRLDAGLPVSGETRRVLRAQLKRKLSKVKV